MKIFTKLFIFLAIVILFGKQSFAQEQRRQWVYELSVKGITSLNEAQKLDSLVMKKTGIYSCRVNYETKTVVVAVMPGIEFKNLFDVVRNSGFVADEKYTVKEETITLPSHK